ncbi:MAG: glycosyltransferase [Pseudomonadota bacterium]
MRYVSILALSVSYWIGWLAGAASGSRRRKSHPERQDLVAIGTFHNPNWVQAHVIPLRDACAGQMYLVTDSPLGVDGVHEIIAPAWMQKLFSRAGAKFIVTLRHCLKRKPRMIVGYHIFPAGIITIIVSALAGCRACYQVTSGALQIEGGGYKSENTVLANLARPSKLVERLAIRMTRCFDLLVVRGSNAENYLRANGVRCEIVTITGSVRYPDTVAPLAARPWDVMFVGRLTEYKRPDRLIKVLGKVAAGKPDVQVALVGDGPDREELEGMVAELGIGDNVNFLGRRADVLDLQQTAKIFILTSRWEGVSIALLEAMCSGTVPVVSNVGDMADFVINDETGYLVEQDDIDDYARRLLAILADDALWNTLSANARAISTRRVGVNEVVEMWQDAIYGEV